MRDLKFLHIWRVYDVENVCTYVNVILFLRAFVWRKIEPKIVSVEKKGQISCMVVSQESDFLFIHLGAVEDDKLDGARDPGVVGLAI